MTRAEAAMDDTKEFIMAAKGWASTERSTGLLMLCRAVEQIQTAVAAVSALEPAPEREEGKELPKEFDGIFISRFAKAVLRILSGVVATPEKGYLADGGYMQMLADIQALRDAYDMLHQSLEDLRRQHVQTIEERDRYAKRVRELESCKLAADFYAAIAEAKEFLGDCCTAQFRPEQREQFGRVHANLDRALSASSAESGQ